MGKKHLDYSVTELDFKTNSSSKEWDQILHVEITGKKDFRVSQHVET